MRWINTLTFSDATNTVRTSIFLLFLLLSRLGEAFVANAFKFVAFEITQSYAVVSLVGSFSAVAFITLGLIAGLIVDATSRRFFALFHLGLFAVLSLCFYILYKNGFISTILLFSFILIHEISSTLHKAAKNTIFYDLCGITHLSHWISWRSIVIAAATMSSSLLLTLFAGEGALLFIVYALILASAYLVFSTIGYIDQNQRQNFTSLNEMGLFFWDRFIDFIAVCRARRSLFFLFVFSFLKTLLVFWPMASGALFKFGIEDDETRRFYLFAIVIMDIVTMTSLYILGRKKSFSNKSFVIGAAVSGLGILLFSLSEGTVMNIITLSVMYIGLAVSQISSSYVLRIELPDTHRTQGLSFAVVPYYLADIVSGIIFALLLGFFNVDNLLFGAGATLILISFLAFPIASSMNHPASEE